MVGEETKKVRDTYNTSALASCGKVVVTRGTMTLWMYLEITVQARVV